MIYLFNTWQLKKHTLKLEKNLIDLLIPRIPELQIREHWNLSWVCIGRGSEPFIQLLHSAKSNIPKKVNDFYSLHGIEIKSKYQTEDFIEIPLTISDGLIHQIQIKNPHKFWKHHDINAIQISNLSKHNIQITNPDVETVKEILALIKPEQLGKLEIENTFEIELSNLKLYTIIDMEDGNYIAVNRKGIVYRLSHDSKEQAAVIDKSIRNFLHSYSGDKNELKRHFNN